MSRWLLALLFAFGTVTFLTGCPAEETKDDTKTEEKKDGEGDKAEGDKAEGDKAEGDTAE